VGIRVEEVFQEVADLSMESRAQYFDEHGIETINPSPGGRAFLYIRKLQTRAEMSLAKRDFREAMRLAAQVSPEITASPVRAYLPSWELRGTLTEGQARLGAGDPAGARPLLERALESSNTPYHPKSPETANAQIAPANCYLDLGRRNPARVPAPQAEAILEAHRQLGEHLPVPMRELAVRVRIVSSTRATTTREVANENPH
jgi:hypothetical protein